MCIPDNILSSKDNWLVSNAIGLEMKGYEMMEGAVKDTIVEYPAKFVWSLGVTVTTGVGLALAGVITMIAKAAFTGLATLFGKKGFNLHNAFIIDILTPLVFAIEFSAQRLFGAHLLDDPSENLQHTVQEPVRPPRPNHIQDDVLSDEGTEEDEFDTVSGSSVQSQEDVNNHQQTPFVEEVIDDEQEAPTVEDETENVEGQPATRSTEEESDINSENVITVQMNLVENNRVEEVEDEGSQEIPEDLPQLISVSESDSYEEGLS